MNQQEHDDQVAEMIRRANSGVCIECGAEIDYMRQDVRAMYAVPCGHRNGLGSATELNRHFGKTLPAGEPETIDIWMIEDAVDASLTDEGG